MTTFQLLQPATIAEACQHLAAAPADTAPLAGGTDLLSQIRDGAAAPAALVSLDAIADGSLRGITDTAAGGIRIGALTTIADIAEDDRIRRRYTALAQAAAGLATPQVRNLGTLGGNLNQRPRCWYYRHPLTPCLKRGGDRCYALAGVGKYLCVTGGDRCYIVHPSDTAVALTALGAAVEIAGPANPDAGANANANAGYAIPIRTVPIEEYFVGPGADLLRENILRPGELLTAITLPPPPAGQRSIYLKARERESGDFALVSVAAAIALSDDGNEDGHGAMITQASIALGGVAPTPYRALGTEAALHGRPLSAISPSEAGAAALANPRPLPDNAYKIPLAANLTARAVATLLAAS